jgi:hypothetical protein
MAKIEKTQAPDKQDEVKKAPPLSDENVAASNDGDRTPENLKKESHPKIDPIKIFTFGLLIVGIIQVVLYWSLLDEAKKQSQAAIDNAKAAVLNAENTMDANRLNFDALQLNEVADSLNLLNFITENRAYVGVVPCEQPNFSGKEISIGLAYKNYGKIPAFKIRGWGKIIVADTIRDRDFRNLKSQKLMSYAILVPNGSDNFLKPVAYVTDKTNIWFNNRTGTFMNFNDGRVIYVCGVIIYNDKFNRQDTTTFCYYTLSIYNENWIPTTQHNEMK